MSSIEEIKSIVKREKSFLGREYQVKSLKLFGSRTRGEQRKDSDLDVLVEFKVTPGLLKFIRLENYLSKVLQVKVDLVTREALKPYIGKHILKEAVPA